MPLVRVEVRNEYAFGAPELYREANKEDPKEVLEGVAVAGLVGVLRQLGDLAEFAAEVFHGLQEEVMRTSSRSRMLMARVKRIETALSPLEKALLAQRSHLHFAYTAGSNWHARIRCAQNHFVYSDVPQFIMDSYDDIRDPPRLHLLDRFDPGGPGSCLKRYSDPTFFRKASAAFDEATADRTSRDKKGCKNKKRRSWTRSREVSRDASFSFNSDRIQFTQTNVCGHSSSSHSTSTYDATKRSDFVEQTTLELRNGSGYIKGDFHPIKSVQTQEQEAIKSGSGYIKGDLHPINSLQPQEQEHIDLISSSVKRQGSDFLDYNFLEARITDAYGDDIRIYPSQEKAGCSSSSVTWDEKSETVLEPKTHDFDNDGIIQDNDHNRHLESFSLDLELETLCHNNAVDFLIDEKMDIQPCDQAVAAPESGDAHLGDVESDTDHFMDALNTIESECETDTDCIKRQDVEHFPKSEDKGVEEGVYEITKHDLECSSSSSESNLLAGGSMVNGNCGNNLISLSPKSLHETSSNRDGYNSAFLVNKDSQSSQRAEDSSTPSSPQGVDSHESDNTNAGSKGVEAGVYEITRHDSECSSSSFESNVLADSSMINDHCGNKLISLSPKSLHATSSNGDEYNSAFLVDKDSQSSQRDEDSLTPSSPQSVDLHESDNTNAGNKGVEAGLYEITRHDSECSSSSSESNVLADSSVINGSCGDNLISVSPKSLHATSSNGDEYASVFLVDKDSQSSQRAEDSLTPGSTESVDSHESDNTNAGNNVESISCAISSQRAEDSLTPGSTESVDSHESDNTNAGNNVESVSCAISFNFSDVSPVMPVTNGISTSFESQKNVPETSNVTSATFWTNGGLLGLQPSKPPDCSILNAPPPPPQEIAHMNDWEISSSTSEADQTENSKHIEGDFNMDSSTCDEHQENGTSFRKTLWKIPPADLDVKLGKLGDSVRQSNAAINGSSVTGSYKKLLPGGEQSFYPAGYQNTNRTIAGRNKSLFGCESPILSPSSSPPLAHMKMYFQPIDGFGTCKLKLKFPYGNTNSENDSDVFPSFQLVPEVFVTRHNIGSDSDGDTFYKSSPSLSDESHSNGSESNSEQWESSESPTNKDRDLYDALREISLTEPVSTVPENSLKFLFVENGIPNSASCRSFDSLGKKLGNDISPKGFVESQLVPTPAPPPLPPVQWQKSETSPKGSRYEFGHMHLPSTVSQPKPAPLSEDRIDTTSVEERKSGLWKSNGQRESNQGKGIDEKEDLLHQIRTKSFNLRPTVTTKPTVPSGGSAYVQVTAILEKANAIRQAVGSDGEDDGNWSEA